MAGYSWLDRFLIFSFFFPGKLPRVQTASNKEINELTG